MIAPRRKLYTYLAVVGLYGVVFGWWMVFFIRQSDYLLRRMARAGVELSQVEVTALRAASDESMRMFLFEGTFLGLMLAASVGLVWRSLHREISVHRQQRNFLSAVTHELKSPLASARLYIESLQLGRVPPEKRERYLTHALEDIDRLRHMVEDLLLSARMASTGPKIDPERMDLASFARERVAHIVHEESLGRARLAVNAPEPVPAVFDPKALETVMRNLVSNAVKYGGGDQEIVVSARAEGHHAVLSVRDHGPGLGAADPHEIFEPFARGGDENVRTRPGVGLGLYIVRELARAHGGSVRARNAEGGGFQVDVSLPLAGGAPDRSQDKGGRAA